MNPWNWTEERQRMALARLEAFRGTPHVHRRRIPGVGVDCINLVYEALQGAGALEEVVLPPYSRDSGWNLAAGRLEAHFLGALNCERVEDGSGGANGDICILRTGKVVNHCGIVFDGMVWHSVIGSGVQQDALPEMAHKLQAWLRITGKGYRKEANGL